MNTITIAGLRARRAELVAEAEKAVTESYSDEETQMGEPTAQELIPASNKCTPLISK